MKLFYILKGLIIGLVIPSIIYMLIIGEQRQNIRELTNQLIQSESDKKDIFHEAINLKTVCEKNMEAVAHKEKLLRKAIIRMGLGEQVKFNEDRLILSQGGE